jgi:tRNA pseudouridine55 synthase
MGLLLGPATKLAPYLAGLDKDYTARVVLGWSTTTDDITGETLNRFEGPWPDSLAISRALQSFLGLQEQTPPAFSAKKISGRSAYKLARAGLPVSLKPQKVRAYKLALKSFEPPEIVFTATVSSGYYIRSLARDLGQSLSLGGGALKELRRERIGPFVLTQGLEPPQDRLEVARRLISPRDILKAYPEVVVTASQAQKVASGGGLSLDSLNVSQGGIRLKPRLDPALGPDLDLALKDANGVLAKTVAGTVTEPLAKQDLFRFELAYLSLVNQDLVNPDLANQDLANLDLANLDLVNLDLVNLALANQDLVSPDLANPDLVNPDLANLDLANPDLTNLDLANPDLTNLDLANPELGGQIVKIIDPQGQLVALGSLETPRAADAARGQSPKGPYLRPFRVFRPLKS